MHYHPPLIPGRLLRRYKRFLADVALADGREVTAHCANTGAMTGLAEPGMRVWLHDSGNPKRKHPLSWELVEPRPGVLAHVNTSRSNALAAEALENGRIPELAGYPVMRREVRTGASGSRLDFLLAGRGRADCYLEVKHLTLQTGAGHGAFPDAVTRRGRRHLEELAGRVAGGQRAVLLFCVARTDVESVGPAHAIDPDYARAFDDAWAAGVEVLARRLEIGKNRVFLLRPVPVTG